MTQDHIKDKGNVDEKVDPQETRTNDANEKEMNDKDEEGFVPVSHRDAEEARIDMTDTEPESSASGRGANLRRMPNHMLNFDDPDEEDSNILNPLMNRLQSRLLSRNSQLNRSTASKFDDLHPYTSVLSTRSVNECEKIENEAFPEHERCSREKFIYRLTQCPELSLGIYTRPVPSEAAKPNVDPSAKLIAHVIATRTPAPAVTDASMDFPVDWQSKTSGASASDRTEIPGHQNEGSTICVHSLAVAKEHQRKGLGSILMKAYIQRIKDSKTAERIALIAHDHLVNFYTSLGFQDMGDSSCTFGGGSWKNMILEFPQDQEE